MIFKHNFIIYLNWEQLNLIKLLEATQLLEI